jgi:hypothetical protein
MKTARFIVVLAVGIAVLLPATASAQADRDCSDFGSWAEAQEFYERSGPGDPHNLDADNDGVACETLR